MKKNILFWFLLFISLPLLSLGQSMTLNITGHNPSCNGSTNGSATAAVSGGVAPYSYVWVPAVGTGASVTDLAPGTYMVRVTDDLGHTIAGSVTIHQPAPLSVYIDSIVVLPCFRAATGGSCGCFNTLWAVVSGGTPPYSYLWTPSGSTGDTVNGACYLEWTVAVTDSGGCVTNDSLFVAIPSNSSSTTGVDQIDNGEDVEVYPNPAGTQLNISFNHTGEAKNFEVYDMAGRKIYDQKLGGSERLVTIDVSGFAGGKYILQLKSGEQLRNISFTVSR